MAANLFARHERAWQTLEDARQPTLSTVAKAAKSPAVQHGVEAGTAGACCAGRTGLAVVRCPLSAPAPLRPHLPTACRQSCHLLLVSEAPSPVDVFHLLAPPPVINI